MNMKSVLMIGQSNMAGRGYLSDVPAIYNENIQMLRNGRWQMVAEPVNCDKPVAGVGLAGSFAAMWAMEHPGEKIGLIPCAEGGSSIDEWHPADTLFRHAVSEARFAMEESELIAILWHQGENDSFGGRHRTYYDKLKQIVDTLRDELGLPDIPFILGGLGDFLEHARLGADCREYREINRELKRFAAEQDNCFFATAEGLASNPDMLHFNAESQRKLGVRYYKAYSTKTDVLHPLENEDGLLDQCINSRPYSQNEKMYQLMFRFATGRISYEETLEQMEKLRNGDTEK